MGVLHLGKPTTSSPLSKAVAHRNVDAFNVSIVITRTAAFMTTMARANSRLSMSFFVRGAESRDAQTP